MAREWSKYLPDLWAAQGGRCCWCQGLTFMVRDFGDDHEWAWPYPRLWQSDGVRIPPGANLRHYTPHWIELFGRQSGRGLRFPVATIDHILPRRTGHDPLDVENMRMACKPCNNARDSMTPRAFLRYLGIDPDTVLPAGVTLLHPS